MDHSPGFLKLVESVRGSIPELGVEELKLMIEQAPPQPLILDVREESEWALGRIPLALPLSKGILERDIEKIVARLDEPIILYCGGGYRSILAAEQLQRMGYQKVWSVIGGFRAWQEAQYPIVRT